MKKEDYEITIIGDVRLTEDEKCLLKLHPKFAIPSKLENDDLEYEFELDVAKLRMEIRKEEEEKLSEEEEKIKEQNMTEEEKERIEEIEAKSRQTFDPEERIYDARKQRVTDLKKNARVTLPKPAGTAH